MNPAQARPERPLVASKQVARLYAVTPDEPDTKILAEKVGKALSGGASLVQYRNKSATDALRREQAAILSVLCRKADVLFIVNDDLELALLVDADGLHLGRDDIDIARAREKLGDGKLLGASCYDSLDRAIAASKQGVDYVAFGSAFPSATKPGATRSPLSLYSKARACLDLPIVAIGGITAENALSVIDAGADAVAVIRALFHAVDIEKAASRFDRLFDQKNR